MCTFLTRSFRRVCASVCVCVPRACDVCAELYSNTYAHIHSHNSLCPKHREFSAPLQRACSPKHVRNTHIISNEVQHNNNHATCTACNAIRTPIHTIFAQPYACKTPGPERHGQKFFRIYFCESAAISRRFKPQSHHRTQPPPTAFIARAPCLCSV